MHSLIRKYKIYLIALTLFLTALIPSAYLHSKYKKSQNELQNLKSGKTDQSQKTIEEVGRLMKLPEGETPTVATITDREKLSNQPFFANAKNGDIVIIYTQAKKAILFDPVAKKIVDVAPLTINLPSPTGSSLTPAPSTSPPLSLNLQNGSKSAGITEK